MKNLLLLITLVLSQLSMAAPGDETSLADEFNDAELAQLLAPIALYPDSVLTHVLIAATYPLEIVQAERWITDNPDIDSEDALEAVEGKSWDPSVKALIQFPELIDRLNDDLDWMQDIGDAFLQDEERVLASIQALRAQADQANSFDDAENIQVIREDGNIVIEPTHREIVYIPYYDTRVVYGDWLWDGYPPVYWNRDWHGRVATRFGHRLGHHNSHHYSHFDWYPGVYLASSFFFNAFHWSNHHIVVADHSSRYWTNHSRNRHFNRVNHRRYMLSDQHGRQWRHNPRHRRGVAYRNHEMRNRLNRDYAQSNKHKSKNANRQYYTDRQQLNHIKKSRAKDHNSNDRNKIHNKAHNNTYNNIVRNQAKPTNKNRDIAKSLMNQDKVTTRNNHPSTKYYKSTKTSRSFTRQHDPKPGRNTVKTNIKASTKYVANPKRTVKNSVVHQIRSDRAKRHGNIKPERISSNKHNVPRAISNKKLDNKVAYRSNPVKHKTNQSKKIESNKTNTSRYNNRLAKNTGRNEKMRRDRNHR